MLIVLTTLCAFLLASFVVQRYRTRAALSPTPPDAFLRQVIDTTPDHILVKDATGRIVLANAAVATFFGRPLGEIVGRTEADLMPDAASVVPTFQADDARVRDTGVPLLVSDQHLTDATGTKRYFQTRKVRMDAAGGPPHVLVVAEDVTERREMEQRVAMWQARTHRLLTNTTDALFVMDEVWNIHMMNPQAAEMLGRPVEDLIGKTLWTEFPEAVDLAFYPEFHRAVAENVPARFTEYYPSLQKWMDVRAYPSEGGLAVYVIDVTAQRAHEAALRLRQERMQFLHGVTSQPHHDVETIIVQTLRHTADLFGMEIGLVSRIEGGTFTLLHAVHPPDVALAAGDTFPLADMFCSATHEGSSVLAVHQVRGSILCAFPVYDTLKLEAYIGVPLVVDGVPYGTLAFASRAPHDPFSDLDVETMHLLGQWISGVILRQQHNAAIAASEERFRQVAEKMTDLVCLHASDGTYRWVSPSMQTLLGYAPEEIIGKSPLDFIHPEDEASLRALFTPRNLIRAARAGMQAEFRYRHRDGHYVWLEALGHLHLSLDGREASLQTTSRNITLRKRFEEQLERVAEDLEARNAELGHARDAAQAADRAKSQFLANMSHEIRTPLNGIMGVADLLLGSDLTEGQRELVGILHTSSDALLTIINDILDFSKIEAGKLELNPEPFRPAALARQAADLIRFKTSEKGLDLRVEVAGSVPPFAVGDEGRLRQVLLNLLSNAAKFTAEGSVTLRVRAEAAPDAHALTFSVADTGIGIAPEKQKELFQRFNQLDASTTKRYGGTGLGLAISQHLVSMMGGEISVTSTPGEGTTFAFTVALGAAVEGEAEPTAPAQPEISLAEHLAGKRLLAVEDNAVNRRVLLRFLEQMGFTADVALDGREALECIDKTAYDVVLMDVQMPEMDGLACTRAIRARGGAQPWIIGLTANALAGDREEVLASGMDDYVSKPLRRDALEAALRRVGELVGW